MPPAAVVELKIVSQLPPCFFHQFVRLQIHFLVLYAFPETLDKHVVYCQQHSKIPHPDVLFITPFGPQQSGFLFLLEPVGFALDVDGGRVVQQPVQYRRGDDRVAAEDLSPLAVGFVGGEDDRSLLVTAADHLEEERRCVLIQGQVADCRSFWNRVVCYNWTGSPRTSCYKKC